MSTWTVHCQWEIQAERENMGHALAYMLRLRIVIEIYIAHFQEKLVRDASLLQHNGLLGTALSNVMECNLM